MTFNPFWLFFAFVVSGVLRSALGRLIGSIATGGFVAVLAWFLIGSFGAALGRRAGSSSSRHRSMSCRRRAAAAAAAGRAAAVAAAAGAAVVPATAAVSAAAAAALAAAAHRGAGSMGITRIGRHLLEYRWRERRIFTPKVLARDRAGDQGRRGHAFRPDPLCRGRRARRRAVVPQPAGARAGARHLLAAAHLGHRAQQRRADLSAARRPRRRDRRRPRHRRQGRHRRLGENLRRPGKANSAPGCSSTASSRASRKSRQLLAQHFPQEAGSSNELPDAPVVL